MSDAPLCVKQTINIKNCIKYFVIECYRKIASASNTFKIITICSSFYRDFVWTYYNDKGDAFEYIFGGYINTYTEKIYYPALIEEQKLILDTSAYENQLNYKENLFSMKQ